MTNFAHLHLHSHYSLLDGLGKVEQYVAKAKELGMTAIALTDKGNVHGLIDLYKACKKQGIKAVLGCEMYIAFRSRHNKEAGIDNRRHHIVLLAKNEEGYENLLKLSSEAFLTGMYYKPRIDMALLQEHSQGLIAILPRVNGEVARHILNEEQHKAEEALKKYQEIFGADLYLEMLHRPKFDGDAVVKKGLQELSEKTGVPMVATNDVYYLNPEDADAHDTLIAMQFNGLKNDPNRFRLLDYDLSLASPEQMSQWFADMPEAIENTMKISEQCKVEFEFGVNRIPKFPLPEGFKTEKEYLRHLCEEGVKERYGVVDDLCVVPNEKISPNPSLEKRGNLPLLQRGIEGDLQNPESNDVGTGRDLSLQESNEKTQIQDGQTHRSVNTDTQQILDRLNFELEIIGKMGFDGYFLIVWDFMKWARDNGIAVGPGRGSAAGSIVSYLLKITNLDPLKYNLLFERFLNPERISMPDIDLDFADDRRDEVINYVAEKYGRDHVAQICTFGTMAARAAVKDVGRVMGLPFTEMNEFGKLIPGIPGTTLDEAEKKSPELAKKLETDETAQQIYASAKKLEGNVRHVSVHACAVLITPDPISQYTAIQHPPKDDEAIITQYSAKPLESLGLLKMDFLGLRNLTILDKAVKIIHRTKGVEIDLDQLPMDDAKAYELLSNALTTGVFQMESAGMRRYLKDLKPSEFEDIIAMVSLYRPGPMQFIPDYIDRKYGKKQVKYVHENLAKILQPTYGIAIYQEQILQMAQVFAGFSLGEADLLRRAIGKKIAKELKAQRKKFIAGAVDQGYEEKMAIYIFDEVIEPFARYGFNRSHAACYALIGYQTAYLKANYPTEFFAALMSCDKENTDRVILDIQEAREFGIEVLAPDINESFSNFTVTGENEIRFGLTAIKGIGESVVMEIQRIRQQGKFETFADFLARMPSKVINKKALEALAKSGALSAFIDSKALLDHMETVLAFTRAESVQQDENQHSLFGDEEIEKAELELPNTAPSKLSERLKWEKEVLGIYVSDHPLKGMKPYFEAKGVPITGIPHSMRFGKKEIMVHGLCTDIRKITTKKNDIMAIVTIEDLSGKIEAVLFPKTYTGFQPFLTEDSFMSIKGKAEKRNGEWQLVVNSLISRDLERARDEAKKENLIEKNADVTNIVETQDLAPEDEEKEEENELKVHKVERQGNTEEIGVISRGRPEKNDGRNDLPVIADDEENEGMQFIASEKKEFGVQNDGEMKDLSSEIVETQHAASENEQQQKMENNVRAIPCGPPENEETGQKNGQTHRSVPTTPPNDQTPYQILLPAHFPREKMRELNHLLSQNEGDQSVELHFHGHKLVFPLTVNVTEELKEQVQQLVG